MAIDFFSVDVSAEFGETRLNNDQIIHLVADWTSFTHFFAVVNCTAFCSRPEVTSDIASGRLMGKTVPENTVRFRDPRLDRSWAIRPRAIGGGITGSFQTWFDKPTESSRWRYIGMSVDQVGNNGRIQFGDPR